MSTSDQPGFTWTEYGVLGVDFPLSDHDIAKTFVTLDGAARECARLKRRSEKSGTGLSWRIIRIEHTAYELDDAERAAIGEI